MKLKLSPLKKLMHRAVLAMVLLAFLVPISTPTPADEIRASYAAAGLLCDPDESGAPHLNQHCVLCLLPAHASPDISIVAGPILSSFVTVSVQHSPLISTRTATHHHARGPPSSIV